MDAELRQAHIATATALLKSERKTLADLRRVAKRSADLTRGSNDVQVAARELHQGIFRTIVAANQRTRTAALDSMRGEWGVLRKRIIAAGINPLDVPVGFAKAKWSGDETAADKAAQEITDLFLREAENMPGFIIRVPAFALEEAAATQTSRSFTGERTAIEKQLRAEHADSQWFPAIIKVWDTMLDRRVCQVCASKGGTIRPLGESWDGLEPGQPHRRCRCLGLYLFTPVSLGQRRAA